MIANRTFLIVVALLTGCVSMGPLDMDERPVLSRTTYDSGGEVTETVEVSIFGRMLGRSCQVLEISPEGEVMLLQAQDGSSDWSSVRGIVAVLPETVATVLSAVLGTGSILGAIADRISGGEPGPAMAPPSPIHGCEGVLVDDAPEDGEGGELFEDPDEEPWEGLRLGTEGILGDRK